MISRAGALGVKRLLPVAVLLVAALSVAVGLTLALADNRVVEIVLAPNTTNATPIILAEGDTKSFTARVITHGEEISVVTLSLMFDPNLLEVVDANPTIAGVQIAAAPGSPFGSGSPIGGIEFGNTDKHVDNATGRIHATFSTFSQTLPNADFDVAVIEFRGKNGPTSPGDPTMVRFVVDSVSWDDTGASKGGTPLLKNDTDFPGAWIRIVQPGVVEIFIEPAGTSANPVEIAPNDTSEFIVKMDTHDEEVTAFTIAIAFDTQFLEVVDAIPALAGVQIQADPTSPFTGFELENFANNQTGVIRYTNGSATPRQGIFNLARITFKAKAETTPAGDPTRVKFRVDPFPDTQTAASRAGLRLLKDLEDYVGAWIRVGSPQTAARISAPDSSDEGQSVTFDGSASTAGGAATGIVNYSWNFGDNTGTVSGSDKATVTHIFADGTASYDVTLTVTDDATPTAGTDTATHTIQVNNVDPTINSVVADPDALPSGGGTSTITVNATDPAGDADPLLYSIDCNGDNDFNDTAIGDIAGSASNTTNCSFASTTTGISNIVKVKVDDQDGGVVTSQQTVDQLAPGAPTADAGPPQTVNEGDTVTLDGSASTLEGGGTPDDFSWTQTAGTPTVTLSSTTVSNPTFMAPDGPATPAVLTFELKVTVGTQFDTDTVNITVNNVAPSITSVNANPPTHPQGGGSSTITVNATDPAGSDDPLKYSVDCNGDGDFTDDGDAADQFATTPFTHTCSFAAAPADTQVVHTVKVKVDDGDNGVTLDQTTVAVGEAQLEDWTGQINIASIGGVSDDFSFPRLFGIRPGCTADFEEFNDSEIECDLGSDESEVVDGTANFYYPTNPDDGFAGTQDETRLIRSRIAPLTTASEDDLMSWPFRVEITRQQATSPVDVVITWDISDIPTEFETVLLIDHSSLPANQVINMGRDTQHRMTIPAGVTSFKGDLVIVVSRSFVQAMPLVLGLNRVSLTIEPLNRDWDNFIFNSQHLFSPPKDVSPTRRFAVVRTVAIWNTDATPPIIDENSQFLRSAGPSPVEEMAPGLGHSVSVSNNDAIAIIPGTPLDGPQQNTRGP